jgi:anti-sigma regulatory factor (Ser/Thr protein kinase)
VSRNTIRVRIKSEADLTRAVLETIKVAESIGFDASTGAMLRTAVSELVRNVLKYAGTGDVHIAERREGSKHGIQVTVDDTGPGIRDLEQAMADHFSTSGTLGLGLPGVRRMADEFEIDSAPGRGTKVVFTKWRTAAPSAFRATEPKHYTRFRRRSRSASSKESEPAESPAELDRAPLQIDWGSYGRPCVGERLSGDAAVVEDGGDVLFAAVVDVLGHGPQAHEVSARAEAFLRASWTRSPVDTLMRLHSELKGTRGAAAGIAVVDRQLGEVRYAGVGNTVARTFGSEEAGLHSVDGTLGQSIRSPKIQTIKLTSHGVLLLYTDGVRSSFKLDDYAQLLYESASHISKKVVERFSRSYDDATCLAVRFKR